MYVVRRYFSFTFHFEILCTCIISCDDYNYHHAEIRTCAYGEVWKYIIPYTVYTCSCGMFILTVYKKLVQPLYNTIFLNWWGFHIIIIFFFEFLRVHKPPFNAKTLSVSYRELRVGYEFYLFLRIKYMAVSTYAYYIWYYNIYVRRNTPLAICTAISK